METLTRWAIALTVVLPILSCVVGSSLAYFTN